MFTCCSRESRPQSTLPLHNVPILFLSILPPPFRTAAPTKGIITHFVNRCVVYALSIILTCIFFGRSVSAVQSRRCILLCFYNKRSIFSSSFSSSEREYKTVSAGVKHYEFNRHRLKFNAAPLASRRCTVEASKGNDAAVSSPAYFRFPRL